MKTKESPRYLSKRGKREVGCFTGRARGVGVIRRREACRRWWEEITWSRRASRPLLWSRHHANWNSIVGTWGRSGSHSLPFIQFGSSEGARLAPPISFFSRFSQHMVISHAAPLLPLMCWPFRSPLGLLCPVSERFPSETDSAGWHATSSRFSPWTWKHLQIYFQGPAWKIFDHALSNSNKWERGSRGGLITHPQGVSDEMRMARW